MSVGDVEPAVPFPAEPFDAAAPLPEGTTLLEASAGTGKTYTIAGLAARFIAEREIPIADLLVVTFGRAATSEMRERVRDRLAAVIDSIDRNDTASDRFAAAIADADAAEVRRRRARLRRALSDFDTASVVTTHQFCYQVLTGLGLAGGVDEREALAVDLSDMHEESISDCYLRDVATDADRVALLPFPEARTMARAALGDPQARLVPDGAQDAAAHLRVVFCEAVRTEVRERLRRRLEMTYDDTLARVRDALADPVSGPAAAARLRERSQVVLVDEFQDTDPVQWEILQRAFLGRVPLILIGDPKQAIYAFRGGDLHTYLRAAESADTRRTLTRNWRSDPAIVHGLQHLFASAALGDERIVVSEVVPGRTENRLSRVTGTPGAPRSPLRLRMVSRNSGTPTRHSDLLTAGSAREVVVADVAVVTTQLLTEETALTDAGGVRPVEPADIAVLVRTNDQAEMVRRALRDADVPAVLSGARNVFASEAARSWVLLLLALEEPHRTGIGRAAALTPLLGMAPEDLVPPSDRTDELTTTLRRWQQAWVHRGVPALLEDVLGAGLMHRALGMPDGERFLTDARQVAEILHEQAVTERLGPTAQREWLQRQVANAAESTGVADERSRRLESDADAVQVMTVHAAKGLEFPVVLVPFGWDRFVSRNERPLRLHDVSGTRLLDVGGNSAASYEENHRRALDEELGEDLRTFYVALTRAASHLVLWWVPSTVTERAPAHRALLGDRVSGQVPATAVPVPTDRTAWEQATRLAEQSQGLLSVEHAEPVGPPRWTQPAQERPPLHVAQFRRPIDRDWRRHSYSGITAVAADTAATEQDEPEDYRTDDEPVEADEAMAGVAARSTSDEEPRLSEIASPWNDLPAGAAFGTVVHEALEDLDTSAADLGVEVRRVCRDAVARRAATSVDPEVLAGAMEISLLTPLGEAAPGLRLCDIAAADRLPELAFEMPLSGGDTDRLRRTAVSELGGLLRHHLPADDPLHSYPSMLESRGIGGQELAGYLVGSIDAVLRVRRDPVGGDDVARYVVVDYKTNRVRTDGDALTAAHYRPDRLAELMMHAHYPLQALLYCVGLHRFLRWRKPGYDPDHHLGPVAYLFLRGMAGPDAVDHAGRPCGVFVWRPPSALVTATSDLLAGER